MGKKTTRAPTEVYRHNKKNEAKSCAMINLNLKYVNVRDQSIFEKGRFVSEIFETRTALSFVCLFIILLITHELSLSLGSYQGSKSVIVLHRCV